MDGVPFPGPSRRGQGYADHLSVTLSAARVVGARVHDAHITSLCSYHGVKELWSADRDFSRYPSLVVRNPLLG